MPDNFDPEKIEDANLHQAFMFLLNMVERKKVAIANT
jgi:hypothetical protein